MTTGGDNINSLVPQNNLVIASLVEIGKTPGSSAPDAVLPGIDPAALRELKYTAFMSMKEKG
jgi:hypothetical protein